MPSVTFLMRLILVICLSFPLFLNGCSYLPWVGDEEMILHLKTIFLLKMKSLLMKTVAEGKNPKRLVGKEALRTIFLLKMILYRIPIK